MSSAGVTALLFEVAGQRYGLDVSQIVEVVPTVLLRKLPSVPNQIAGVFCYRGAIVPVIDLSQLLGGAPAAQRLSTRVALVRYPGTSGAEHVLGLLVEHAAQGLVELVGELKPPGITTPDAPYLGKIATRGVETIQLLQIQALIPPELRERLFTEE